ncbi:PDZ and LIM domain protein 5-like isoform X6 [Dreissena polymorpha]|uniref:PDZ and LIM domain protein 5-like isoform X6 n=1 Tax=Dreissena polymorpha TaxID=45954 RepID=UPI0022643250|nr:PDZ and LIM domain protein 5-like isoform X6 [Dreissena polymorpha]
MSLVQVRLARDSLQTPWGFRLQGGKDLSQELVVQRVFANTPSEGELQRGDVIVAINGRDTSNLSHKQAQDAITGGGGQIELLVQRPLGPVSIKPLTPKVDTRAPSFPQSPVRAPQIVIPVYKPGKSGPKSPVRIVPISPHKPASHSDTGSTHAATDNMDSAGFMPKKVTLNKFGGGTTNFGTSFGSAPGGPQSPQRATHAQGYRPVAAPAQVHTQETQVNYQTQFSAPQQSPHSSYTAAVPRSRKSLPTFGRPRAGEEASYTTFGVDYSKPLPKPQPSKHSGATRARPPPVNARIDETDSGSGWTGTLRGESKQLKPWEREALEMERYQSGTVDQPYRPHTQPPVAPKPKIVQISAQSTVRSSGQPSSGGQSHRSVSPSVPPKPSRTSASRPDHGNHLSTVFNSAPDNVSGGHRGPAGGSNVVHLQYNSPIGLYSKDNVRDTYIGQTQARAASHSPGGAQVKPAVPGDRDWNNSYVYQMVHSSEKTTSSSASGRPGQPMTGETVTTTRRTEESRYPGQEPQRHVTETVQRHPITDYKYDNAIMMSDF